MAIALTYHSGIYLGDSIRGKKLDKLKKKLENKPLDENLYYDEIEGLRLEAIQKLNQIKPRSVGQASRISGVSPADINVILVYLEKQRRKKH